MTTLSMAWVHNLDPFAIQFTETFGLRWYGLAYLAGFVLGYYAIVWMSRRGKTQFVKEDQIADFITWAAIGVLAGGRIGYVLFYSPDLLWSFTSAFPFWGVFRVNEGGMSSHGGILGVMFVCWAYGRLNKMSFLHLLDLTVYGSALGFFFGRLANFVNGELYGRAAAEGYRYAVKFPQEMALWVQRDFQKLYGLGPAVEALKELRLKAGESIALSAETWRKWLDEIGDQEFRENVHQTVEALMLAVQEKNYAVTEALRPALTARYPSQLYQAFLEGLLVFFILLWLWRKPQKTGVIAAWFGTLYCVARIIGEQFRMPDAHIGYQLFDLTRGQWISIAMLLVAIVFLVTSYRSSRPKLGGWSKAFDIDSD